MPGNAEKHDQLTCAEGGMGLGQAGKISQDVQFELFGPQKTQIGGLEKRAGVRSLPDLLAPSSVSCHAWLYPIPWLHARLIWDFGG